MFRTSYFHHHEEYIVHAALYCMITSSTSFNLVDRLHKRMENIPYKAVCTRVLLSP